MFSRISLLLATWVLASVACTASEPTTHPIRTVGTIYDDALKSGDWNSAYEELERYLGVRKKNDRGLDEYRLLGLSRQEVEKIFTAEGFSLDGKMENASFGCGQGGSFFDFKYNNNKVIAVRASSYGLDSTWSGPWVTSRSAGLRRAELKVSSEIERALKDGDRNAEALIDLYRYRAQLRKGLGEDEYAARDLFEVCILLRKHAGGAEDKNIGAENNHTGCLK